DLLGPLVLLGALSAEDLAVDHGADDAGRDPQLAVADVAGHLTEDRAQELLLGAELGLALARDLAHEEAAGPDCGADRDDPGFVEVAKGLLSDVRDVAGDLLLAELGVAGAALELLDVNRGVDVIAHEALADQDRVLEVELAPGHEGDQAV